MKNKSKLRRNYESIYGSEICDRVWRRIRNEYMAVADEYEPSEEDELAIAGLAFLRKIRPYGKVRRLQAVRFGRAVEKFNHGGYGRDIAAAIATSFEPVPDRTTFWRWGLRMDEYHNKFEVIKVLGKVLGSDRYKLRSDQPRMIETKLVA